MTAKEVYESIRGHYPGLETTICQLHKPCSAIRKCLHEASKKEVIDFDRIESAYHKNRGLPSKSSVDAVTCDNADTVFCFVELKGWNEFLTNPYQKKSVSEEGIKKQAKKYDLKGKLENSLFICQEISGNPSCFKEMEIVFVLVTDIEVKQSPLESLAYHLTMLAETASKWEDLCNKYLLKVLAEVEDIKKYYINCKDFESLMARL